MEENHRTAVLSSDYSLGSWISEADFSVGSAGWSKKAQMFSGVVCQTRVFVG